MYWYMQDGPRLPIETRPFAPIHVAVVEDHPAVGQSYQKLFSTLAGVSVDIIPTPDEAKLRFKQIGSPKPIFPNPQLVVLDWNVQGENTGMDILLALREREAELKIKIPTIIITSEPERVRAQFGQKIKLVNAATYNTQEGFETPIVGKEQYDQVEALIQQTQQAYARARSTSST